MNQDEREAITKKIQNAGTEVVEAKAGTVSIIVVYVFDILVNYGLKFFYLFLIIVLCHIHQGSASLSMSYAGNHFVTSLLKALHGEDGVIECAYVRSENTDAKYFASPVLLGVGGGLYPWVHSAIHYV